MRTQVYTDTGQAAILDLQRHGARLVRMRHDGKRPAFKWGGRTGRCLTDRQAESWLRTGGRFALVPHSIGFTVMDVDDGPWQDLATVYPPHAVIPSRKLWRRHLYYPDHEGRPNANGRRIHGCHVDVRSIAGYVALWQPEAVLEAAEKPRQGDLFPWWLIWPEKGDQGPPRPPGKPPAPPVGEPRDGPLSDAYPKTRNSRLFEVVASWGRTHAREHDDLDRWQNTVREHSLTRATEIPDLTDFDDDPAEIAYKVAVWTWERCRPIHDNNRRWHNNENFDLEGRDAALVALRTQGVTQEAIGELHGLSKGQVSKRLRGHESTPEGDGMKLSVTCRSCDAVFSAAKASALYCGSACRVRAFRAKKGGLSDDSHALEGTDLCGR